MDTGTTAWAGPSSNIATFNIGVNENQFSTFTVIHGAIFSDYDHSANPTKFRLAIVNHYEDAM